MPQESRGNRISATPWGTHWRYEVDIHQLTEGSYSKKTEGEMFRTDFVSQRLGFLKLKAVGDKRSGKMAGH